MTKQATARPRPLSPHLQVYRWPITMTMSIAHRVSGGALYFGTFFLAAWLVSMAAGREYFEMVNSFYNSFIGRSILFLYTLGLVHHLVGGLRHLIWDAKPALLDKVLATRTAQFTIVLSLVLTCAIWLVGYMIR